MNRFKHITSLIMALLFSLTFSSEVWAQGTYRPKKSTSNSTQVAKPQSQNKTKPTTSNNTLKPTAGSGKINGHEYVDLGLPSGLKWATCNVGASSSTEFGDYYAWGEISPKSEYTQENYKPNKITEDISGNPKYDVARANWGGQWRIPTKAEFLELFEFCKLEIISRGGKMVYKMIGPNGNYIIFPAAGCHVGRTKNDESEGLEGYYWSSTPYSDADFVYIFYVATNGHGMSFYSRNYGGRTVRPVTK